MKPSYQEQLAQLDALKEWCNNYLKNHPTNSGSYSGGLMHIICKPLRDGIVFYSRGWGWRLRIDWQETLEHKREELQRWTRAALTGRGLDA